MTNPDLAALSEAATYDALSAFELLEMQTVNLGSGAQLTDTQKIYAYERAWPYMAAAVHVCRTGDLVLIDRDGMRERACFALGGFIPLPPGKTIPDAADAAIAAILGEEKP